MIESGYVFTCQGTNDKPHLGFGLQPEDMAAIASLRLQITLTAQRQFFALYNGDQQTSITQNAPRSWLAVDVYDREGGNVVATKTVWLKPVLIEGIAPHNQSFARGTGLDVDPDVWEENDLGKPVAPPFVFPIDVSMPSYPVNPLFPTEYRLPLKFRHGFITSFAPDLNPEWLRLQTLEWWNVTGFFTVMRLNV